MAIEWISEFIEIWHEEFERYNEDYRIRAFRACRERQIFPEIQGEY
jgi:hypothetical protein